MEKLFKGKNNFKKIISDKEFHSKNDQKHSQTLSTNQSKIHHQLDNPTAPYFPLINLNWQIIKKLRKYGTSDSLFYLTNFEETFCKNRTKQAILLKDICNFKDEEKMEKFYSNSRSMQQLAELFEYYKYYINNPILFSKEHFKTLYNFYERKKYLQYKRLKAVLDLDDEKYKSSDDSINDNISIDIKKTTKENSKSFYIMNLIQTEVSDKSNHSESKAFQELKSDLEQILSKMDSVSNYTPQSFKLGNCCDKNMTFFKKKRIQQLSSSKNTIIKKNKKFTFQFSNFSLKNLKNMKPIKELPLSKFSMEKIDYQTNKVRYGNNLKKVRQESNLSMGELESKFQAFNIYSPKKYQKKRFVSCQTAISKNGSKERPTSENKSRNHHPHGLKFRQKKQEITQSQQKKFDFKQIIQSKRKNTQKAAESGVTSLSSKVKRQASQEMATELKQLKKKGSCKVNSSAKNSLQRSPYKDSRENLVTQSIVNLKKKIRIAKQMIKTGNTTSTISSAQYKKEKTFTNFTRQKLHGFL